MSLPGELLELADTATLIQDGEATGPGIHHPPPHADSRCPVARPPKVESQHRCPQLEALQQKLRRLEKENDHLREEVRTGRKARPSAGGGDSLAPFLFPFLQASHLDNLEDEEQMLILECVEQFCTWPCNWGWSTGPEGWWEELRVWRLES